MKYYLIDPFKSKYTYETLETEPLGGTQTTILYFASNLSNYFKNDNVIIVNQNINESFDSNENVTFLTLNDFNYSLVNKDDTVIGFNFPDLPSKFTNIDDKPNLIHWCTLLPEQSSYDLFKDNCNLDSWNEFIFVSYYQQHKFLEKYDFKGKTTVLKNGISKYFEKENLFPDNKFKIENKKLQMIYTSLPQRGLPEVVKVFNIVKEKVPDITLEIYSSMHLYQMNEQENNSDIQNLYNQIKQIDGINYHPSISQKELANHIKDSLLYVYPCVEEETSCICLMEAMASGCICLVNNIGALYETGAGYCDLFNSTYDKNIKNMADKIIILCQNNLKKIQKQIIDQIEFTNKFYNWNRNVNEFTLRFNEYPCNKFEHLDITLDEAIQLMPRNTFPCVTFGRNLRKKGFYLQSSYCFYKALEINDTINIRNELAVSLMHNDINKAIEVLEPINNKDFFTLFNLSTLYLKKKVETKRDYDKCKFYLKKCIELEPDNDECYSNLAFLEQQQGNYKKAIEIYKMINKINPSYFVSIKIALLTPLLCYSNEEAEDIFKKSIQQITELIEIYKSAEDKEKSKINFQLSDIYINSYIHYSITEPNKSKYYNRLQSKLYRTIYPNMSYKADFSNRKKKDKNSIFKIGFVSNHFYNHSAGKLIIDLVLHMKKFSNIETVLISSFQKKDKMTQFFIDNASKILDFSNTVNYNCEYFDNVRKKVEQEELDVIIYTDLGADNWTYFLAHSRLSPIQMVYGWGHPVTSGINTIDYFILPECRLEEKNEWYSEKIIPIQPWFYDYTKWLDYTDDSKDIVLEKKWSNGATKYLCPQSPFKYTQQFFEIIDEILKQDEKAEIIFVKIKSVFIYDIVDKMIKKYVNYYNIKRIIFIEKMEHNILLQYMKEADVVLDTCNWVGGITSLEVLSTGTPIITMPTEQLASRLTYIIYQYCQDKFVKNLIVSNKYDYVNKAIILAGLKRKLNFNLPDNINSLTNCTNKILDLCFEKN